MVEGKRIQPIHGKREGGGRDRQRERERERERERGRERGREREREILCVERNRGKKERI